MKPTIAKIEEIKKHGYRLDFGEVLEQTFANYKKIVLITGAVLLLLFFMFFVVVFTLSLAFAGIGAYTQTLVDYSPNATTSTAIIINLLITVLAAALIAPLTAGLLKIAHLAYENKEFNFSTAFDHYKSKYVKDIVTGTLIISFTSQGITTIFNLLTSYDDSFEILFNIIAVSIGLLISLLTYLMIPLVIFGNLNATEAIKASIVLVLKKFWIILFLLIVCIICVLLGLAAICIGIIFTLPLLYSLQYSVYRNTVGIEEIDELDEIGTNIENF